MENGQGIKCKCGNTDFGFFDDYGHEYNYCLKCNTAYDDEGHELPDYYDDPDNERDIKEE